MKLTRKKALDMSIDLWMWLSENPMMEKDDYPKIKSIENFYARCPLCEFYDGDCFNNDNTCPLWENECADFFKWAGSIRKKTRKKYATVIYKKLFKAGRIYAHRKSDV
jgi:hypothetical protein